MVSDSRVYSKQQDSYYNKDFTFYSKLQKRVKDRGRYQKKRESKKGDRICREDKESTRGSRSGIKRSTKEYEEREQQEVKSWKKSNKVMLSTKDLAFKERPVKRLTERYVGLYKIEKVVSKNTVKLKLPISIRIHSVINVSRIEIYRELVKRQKVKKPKLVEVIGVEK